MSEPAWHPDPTGRHQYRWWDGAAWTDSISDNGVVGTDPLQASAPQTPVTPQSASAPQATIIASTMPEVPTGGAPQPSGPQAGASPFGAQPFGGQTAGTDLPFAGVTVAEKKKSSPLKWIIPIVVVLAVGAVLFFVLGGGDDSGGGTSFGAVEGELENDDSVVSFDYELKRGDVIRVRVEPSSRLDSVALVLVDSSTAREFGNAVEDRFSDDGFTDASDFFTDAGDLFSDADLGELADLVSLQTIDNGFEGEPDADFVAAFADGTYTIAVTSYDSESQGSFRLIVEKFDEQLPIDDLDSISDLDQFFSDNDSFFSDEDFFSNEDEFDTGS
jgi:Protein of unknown function (DUF2510)